MAQQPLKNTKDTHLTDENIRQAQAAVTAYKGKCAELFKKLHTEVENLQTQENFIGAASNGFAALFVAMTPALRDNLYGDTNSVTAMLEQVLTSVEKALRLETDPQLETANNKTADGAVKPANVQQ